MEASIESKRKEEQDLNEQDIVAHRRLRDAIAAAAVECKQHIENCDENLKFLKQQVTIFKLTYFIKMILMISIVFPATPATHCLEMTTSILHILATVFWLVNLD